MTWIIVSKSILKRKSYNIFCSWFHTVLRHKTTYILIQGSAALLRLKVRLIYFSFLKLHCFTGGIVSHPRWWQGKLFKDLHGTHTFSYFHFSCTCLSKSFVGLLPCRSGGGKCILHIAVVNLLRLLSHLQISPKIKEGGGEKRKGVEEAEEISKKKQSQKFPVFSKKNVSLKKWTESVKKIWKMHKPLVDKLIFLQAFWIDKDRTRHFFFILFLPASFTPVRFTKRLGEWRFQLWELTCKKDWNDFVSFFPFYADLS